MKITSFDTTKQLLCSVALPEETKSYKPISHEELIELTLNGISNSGFAVEKELYSSAMDGQIATGRYTLSNIADKEMQIQIGWQNSYNKKITLKYAIGVNIMICSNGAVAGDMGGFKKKHIGDIQTFTPKYVTEYIKTAGDVFVQMQKHRDEMKQFEVNKRLVSELVGRLFLEQGVLGSTELNIIKKELIKPTHDYQAPGSMWELYNFITYSLKGIHPSEWMESHIALHTMFVDVLGTKTTTPSIIVEPVSPFIQLDLFKDSPEYIDYTATQPDMQEMYSDDLFESVFAKDVEENLEY